MKKKNPTQLNLFAATAKTHGGQASVGRAKTVRPIATKRPMHVILRSERAVGEWSLLKHSAGVEKILQGVAKKFGVRVHRFANVGNHIHLLVQVKRREDFQNFLRVFAQKVMFFVTKAKKGKPAGKFWSALAFSRVVEWGRDWQNMLQYVQKNLLEARGLPRNCVDWWFGFKSNVIREAMLGSR